MPYFLLKTPLNFENIDMFTPPEVSSQKEERFIMVSEMMDYILLVYVWANKDMFSHIHNYI